LEDAKEDEDDAALEQAYIEAHANTVQKKTALETATSNLENENGRLAKAEETYAFLTSKEQTDAVKELVDSYNALSKEYYGDLYIQQQKDQHAAQVKYSEYSALNSIYSNSTEITSVIKDCNEQIATLEKDIATYSAVATKEEAIETEKIKIANTEAEIALKEKEVADAKAAFEAATADTATGEE
jgi:hypothetical protein